MASDTPSVEDYLALTQLKHEYCYRIDDGDYDEWVALFAEDGTFGPINDEFFEGTEGLRRFAEEVFDESYDFTAHVVSNPVIEVDGDEATGRWYLHLRYETSEGDVGWSQARYEDEFRRVDGEWRFESVTLRPGQREHV